MGLETYRKKRNFRETPEPSGAKKGKEDGRMFVIQKHAARRLHYDFRLELDGTLKSWAVPKGPSFDPAQKRLAVHVEDHPVEYGAFEGIIPPHQYGSGTVMIWDHGTWEPVGDPRKGYQEGNLKFTLKGEKLHGGWALVRMHGARRGEDNWLLIKETDEHVQAVKAAEIVDTATASVVSGRELEQIAADPARVWQSTPTVPAKQVVSAVSGLSGTRKAPLPDLLKPQLARLVLKPPTGEGWIHELKYDGYRILCRLHQGRATLYSRSEKDWTARLASIAQAAAQLAVTDAWLDGEVVVIKPDGTTSFQALQNALADGGAASLHYFVFDILHLNGLDLRDAPLIERKHVLADILQSAQPEQGVLRFSDHIENNGELFFGYACDRPLEGIISKRAAAPYRAGRGRDWVKVKCMRRQEFVVAGFTDPAGARQGFGALLLGVYDAPGSLHYSGRVGTGFNASTLSDLTGRLKKLKRKMSAFVKPPSGMLAQGVHWVKPELVAEVSFTEWTDEGSLRHPVFLGLREDKPAREVMREMSSGINSQKLTAQPKPATRAPASSKPLTRPDKKSPAPASTKQKQENSTVAGITLSHPERVLYADIGLTKLDLAHYYASVAPWILPHLNARPLSVVRCPQGSADECFYQKHASDAVAEQVERIKITHDDGPALYMMANSLPAIIGLVQMGVLELHTWGSRSDHLDKPDRMIFDLDPGLGVAWETVIEAAHIVRDRLTELKLTSFLKTTGGKGLHIVVPLARRHGWDEVKAFSKALADELALAMPKRFTAKMAKAGRSGKIFIDYLRNGEEATAVAAFSTRARPGAPVSVPIAWEELGPKLTSDHFTATTVIARLDKPEADPWANYWGMQQTLTKAMKASLTRK